MKTYDVVIIGSGPGGYVCAIRCAQLGLQTALIEKYSTLGGTCLNVGCIPSKAWLDSSEKYYEAKHLDTHGINLQDLSLNYDKMKKRVESVVGNITKGVEFLMKKNKIQVFHGTGSFQDPQTILVSGKNEQTIKGKNIIIATGSKPTSLPGVKIDKKKIITSTEALYLPRKPKSLSIIGGGVIGLELGSVFTRLGCEVTVIEYTNRLIPTMDHALGKELMRVLKKQGMKFLFKTVVKSVSNTGKETTLTAQNQNGEEITIASEYTLVAVGRRPYTEKLNLAQAQVQTDERGYIQVDQNLRTTNSHIYAIGDVVPGPMLAHKAEEEGIFVAEQLVGQKPHINHHLIPAVIYTWPEVAFVGSSEEQLQEKSIPYKTGLFPFKASGRAKASGDDDGFVKVLSHTQTDEILGVHMIGPRCSDMIAEAVLAMEYRASAEDIGRTCHPHPTFSEALKEAALQAQEKRALHI